MNREQKGDPIAIARDAVAAARTAEADEADAYVRVASELSLEVRDGEIETLRRATTRGLGLRVTVDGRTALVHTTDLAGLSVMQLAARAVEIARTLPETRDPVVRAERQEIDALPHPDPDLMTEPVEKRVAWLKESEKAMLAVSGVTRAVSTSWSEADGEIALVNSRGLRLYAPFCRINNYTEAIAERDGESVTGGRYIAVPSRKELLDPERFGREAGERAIQLLGARPIPSTKAPVIFTPYTGWTLLASLAGALRGDNVVQQRSYLADRMGRQIAAPGVTIRDNPLLRSAVARRSFDAEGTPARNIALVDQGQLGSYLTDLASAAKLGIPPGGNAVRGSYSDRVAIGTTNLYMEPGQLSPDEILQDSDRALLVTVLSGWWVGRSPARDDFSSAAMGIWIEKGERVHPVRGVTIAGSLLEMLSSVDRIGNDLSHKGETSTPTFRVAEMTISGT